MQKKNQNKASHTSADVPHIYADAAFNDGMTQKRQSARSLLQSNCTDREEVLARLDKIPKAKELYDGLPKKLQEEFLLFCEGKSGIWLCYDTFFKAVFHPDVHPKRLERFLSAIMGQKVTVLSTISNEGTRIIDRGSYVIMDIVVRLADGTIVNLEIQKIGYRFPAKRFDCYCADLIMREYTRLKELNGDKKFSYAQMPLVYCIVLFEDSPAVFKCDNEHYIHTGRMRTDTGIEPDSISRHIYVTLDIFKKQMQNKAVTTELEAWLTLLSTQNLDTIAELIEKFDGFAEIYREIIQMRTKPEELIKMFDSCFRELDRNEELMYLEEVKNDLAEAKSNLAETKNENIELRSENAEKDNTITEMQSAIVALQAEIERLKNERKS
jgi:uncharacterized small protein (DUF1192 family)